MTTQDMMRQRFKELYQKMATSKDVSKMQVFGNVIKAAMEWAISNRPELAEAWMEELECTAWNNYVTMKEADRIVNAMVPKRPWSMDQWKVAMGQHALPQEEEPYYNRYALYVVMNMIMSDSSGTLVKYIGNGDLFKVVHELAVDKLKDQDGKFNVREYFGVVRE